MSEELAYACPPTSSGPSRYSSTASRRRRARDFNIDGRTLVFDRELGPRASSASGAGSRCGSAIAGTYRQNDSVDVAYRRGGKPVVAAKLPLEPLDPSGVRRRARSARAWPRSSSELLDLRVSVNPAEQPSIERLHGLSSSACFARPVSVSSTLTAPAVGRISRVRTTSPSSSRPSRWRVSVGPSIRSARASSMLGPPRFALEIGEDEPRRHRAPDLGEGHR